MKIATFVPGSIIRHITTAHPYVVIQRLTHAVQVVDAESKDIVQNTKVILERDFDRFTDDLSFECRTTGTNGHTRLIWEQAVVL